MAQHSFHDSGNFTFKRVVNAIEALRTSRMNQYKRQHPSGKRFTQQELNDMACPTYKNYLDGRSRRMPSRQTLLDISIYLECTPAERDYLLQLAYYLPEPTFDHAEPSTSLLTKGRALMRDLQLPSLLVTRDYRVHTVCPNFSTLLGTPHIASISEHQRNLFQLLYNRSLSPNLNETTREKLLYGFVGHLKLRNALYEQHTWYKELTDTVRQHMLLRKWWRDIKPHDLSHIHMTGCVDWADGADIAFTIVKTPVDDAKTTYMLTLLPSNERARTLFEEIGCKQTPSQSAICRAWEKTYHQPFD